MDNEIVRPMTPGQLKDLAATAIGFVPNELTWNEAQLLVGSKGVLNKEVRRLFFDTLYKARREFSIIVDYSWSFNDLVTAGYYDEQWTEIQITAGTFPIEGEGVYERRCVLFKETDGLSGVLREMECENIKPAKIEDLLALGAQYPGLQQYFSIFAHGSECSFGEISSLGMPVGIATPILDYHEGRRRLVWCNRESRDVFSNRMYAGVTSVH